MTTVGRMNLRMTRLEVVRSVKRPPDWSNSVKKKKKKLFRTLSKKRR